MVDKKISQLTEASLPLTGSEKVAIVQTGETVKTSIENLIPYKFLDGLIYQTDEDDPVLYINHNNLPFSIINLIRDSVGYYTFSTTQPVRFGSIQITIMNSSGLSSNINTTATGFISSIDDVVSNFYIETGVNDVTGSVPQDGVLFYSPITIKYYET